MRRQELIAAAARLFGSRGYYTVTVDDIGEAVGLSGPALYRHFPKKEALLVAVFDQVVEHWTDRIRDVVARAGDPAAALDAVVRLHVQFAVEQRQNLRVWRQEFHHLPEADSRRLRRAQRLYVEEWVHVVTELRPECSDTEVRTLVHAVIGMLQSPSEFASGLPEERITNLLVSMAFAAVFGGTTSPVALSTPTDEGEAQARTA